jgi:hypothetical protein
MGTVRTVGRKIMKSYQEASKVVQPTSGVGAAGAEERREEDTRQEVAGAGKKWGLLDWDPNWPCTSQNHHYPGRLAWTSHRIGCQTQISLQIKQNKRGSGVCPGCPRRDRRGESPGAFTSAHPFSPRARMSVRALEFYAGIGAYTPQTHRSLLTQPQ